MTEGTNSGENLSGAPPASAGSPDPQATTEVAVQKPGAPAMTVLPPAAAPLRKLKAYLLEPADRPHKEVARFEFEGVELPKVIVWWKDTFVREGTSSLYRRASAVFMNWGEEAKEGQPRIVYLRWSEMEPAK